MIGVYGLAREPLPAARLVRPYYAAEIEMLKSPLFREAYRLHRGHTPGGCFPYFQRIETEEDNERRASNRAPH